jgi:hypothetical protein
MFDGRLMFSMFGYMRNFMNDKLILVIIWGVILGINTWTANLEALLHLRAISFKWISSPYFLSFFYLEDISNIHTHFIMVKLGHFLGFAVLDLLLFNWTKSHKWSLMISIFFALLTEILQLFFGRDGRLYDLMIDSLGAIAVYFLRKIHFKIDYC